MVECTSPNQTLAAAFIDTSVGTKPKSKAVPDIERKAVIYLTGTFRNKGIIEVSYICQRAIDLTERKLFENM